MRILLDTCTFLWWSTRPERLGVAFLELIDRPDVTMLFSAATPWELSIKAAKAHRPAGALQRPIEDAVKSAIALFELTVLPISVEHGLRAGALAMHHRDPFDRMLIAQALVEDVPIATPDPAFAPYGVKLLWA